MRFPYLVVSLFRKPLKFNFFCPNSKMTTLSDLSHIEIKDFSNPVSLLFEWKQEAEKHGVTSFLMNLATATRTGNVSNRTVVVTEILPDASLAFLTQLSSCKLKDIKDNPQVATTLLLFYQNGDQNVTRQVRYKGTAEKLPQERCKIYYEKEDLPAKIRSHICQDCQPVDWNELKKKHDQVLKDVVESKKELDMPETLVAYKVVPHTMEFYSSVGNTIADRIVFKLDENRQWRGERVMT